MSDNFAQLAARGPRHACPRSLEPSATPGSNPQLASPTLPVRPASSWMQVCAALRLCVRWPLVTRDESPSAGIDASQTTRRFLAIGPVVGISGQMLGRGAALIGYRRPIRPREHQTTLPSPTKSHQPWAAPITNRRDGPRLAALEDIRGLNTRNATRMATPKARPPIHSRVVVAGSTRLQAVGLEPCLDADSAAKAKASVALRAGIEPTRTIVDSAAGLTAIDGDATVRLPFDPGTGLEFSTGYL